MGESVTISDSFDIRCQQGMRSSPDGLENNKLSWVSHSLPDRL